MMEISQQIEVEEQEITLLKELLPKISREYRAYIKGATEALLYAQENSASLLDTDKQCFGE